MSAIKRIGGRFAAGIALALLLVCQTAGAATYSFIKIADTNSGAFASISQFSQNLALNENGEVAFSAGLSGNKSGIFKGSGGSITTIATANDTSLATVRPAINDSGLVAFTSGQSTIYVGSGGTPTPLYTSASGYSFLSGPALNNSGLLTFVGSVGTTQYILTGNGGALTQIASNTGVYEVFNTGPAINNAGQVAWSANYRALLTHQTLYRSAGGDTAIYDSPGQGNDFIDQFSMNNSSVVAFGAIKNGSPTGIYYGSGGAVNTLVDTTGPFGGFTDGNLRPKPGINDQNQFAFWAGLKTIAGGGQGIFTGTDPIATKVIKTGDTLFGHTITDLAFSGDGFNNAGQIAFVAVLDDGDHAVVLATVPEPGTALALAIGAALIATRRGHPN